jgi:tRNA A-37 threonylcarbamoyl transferase component Bud32
MPREIIAQGAEAVLYTDKYQDRKVLVKERVKKGYRAPELDRVIRSVRTKREESLLDRARRAGTLTPRIWDVQKSEFRIIMEYVNGERLKDTLSRIHGDLTTSNMILEGGRLYLIDFGLGKLSQRIEDQAVDLFLLYEALKSTHFKILKEAWKNVLNTYKQNYRKSKEVLNSIERIKVRRRYKGE